MEVTNDHDANVEQNVSLIIYYIARYAIIMESKSPNIITTDIHDGGVDIDMSKIFPTFEIRMHETFSTKGML